MIFDKVKYVIAFLIFSMMIVFSTSIEKSGANTYIFVAIIGLYLYVSSRNKEILGLNSNVVFYSKICAFFLFLCVASYIFNGFKPEQLKSLESPFLKVGLIFFFALGISFFFQGVRSYFLYYSLGLLTIVSFFVSVDQAFSLNLIFSPNGRPGGVVNPIYFGNLALVSGYLCLTYSAFLVRRRNYTLAVILAVCGAAGLVASLLSQSRGGWVSLLFFTPLLFWYSFRVRSLANIYLLFFVFLVVSLVGYFFGSYFYDRIILAYNQMTNYAGVGDHSSIGLRLSMWSHAISLIIENPFFGVGPDAYSFTPTGWDFTFYHSHNDYLQVASTLGIPALVLFLMIYTFPLYVFFNKYRADNENVGAISGIVFTASFMFFSLTDVMFYRSVTVVFYFFVVVFLMVKLDERESSLDNTLPR